MVDLRAKQAIIWTWLRRIKNEVTLASDMSSTAFIKAEVERRLLHRFPAEFGVKGRPALSSIPTGIAALDELCAGIPCGALTEICANHSTGNHRHMQRAGPAPARRRGSMGEHRRP